MERARDSAGQTRVRCSSPRPGDDLSQPPEPEEICGVEQRVYVSRIRLSKQRPANGEAAGLCGGRRERAGFVAGSGRDCGGRIFWRELGIDEQALELISNFD